MQHMLSKKERERKRVGGRDFKKAERERSGEGERESGRHDPERTIPLKISKNKLFLFLVCLAFFSFQNFSIGITWNLKKNNLRFSVGKNFQQAIRFYKCLLKNKTHFEERLESMC